MIPSPRLLVSLLGAAAIITGVAFFSLPRGAPPAAARNAAAVPGAYHPAETSGGLASVAASSPREALLANQRAKLGPAATPDEIMALIQRTAGADTGLAIELAHALGRTEEEKTAWVADLAKRWAERSPQQAWDWLSKQDKLHLSDLAVGTIPEVMIGAMAQNNPALLLRNVDQLVRTGDSPAGVAPVVAVHIGLEALVANQQLEAARHAVEAWARDPAQPAIGEAAYVVVANAMAKAARPDDAAQWMLSMPRSGERDIALVEYPAHWAQTDPRGALAWIEQNAPAELRDAAVRRTFNDWTERASADAAEWLGTYLSRAPANAETDRLIGAVINLGAGVKSDPTAGLQWAALLSDPATRATYEEKVVLRWARQDETSATAYMSKSTTLTPARKQAMMQKIASPTFRQSEG